MSFEARIVAISCFNGYLPIDAVGIQCGKENIVPKTINAIIHPWRWVRIIHRGFIESPGLKTEPQRYIALWNKNHRASPFRRYWLDESLVQLVLHILLAPFTYWESLPVIQLVSWFRSQIEFDAVLFCLQFSQVATPHTRVLPQNLHDPVFSVSHSKCDSGPPTSPNPEPTSAVSSFRHPRVVSHLSRLRQKLPKCVKTGISHVVPPHG